MSPETTVPAEEPVKHLETETEEAKRLAKRAQEALDRQSLRATRAANKRPLRDSFINSMARKSRRHITVDEAHELGLLVNAIEWQRKVTI